MANKVIVRDTKSGEEKETMIYDARFSAEYTLQLVWCSAHRVNVFDKKMLERAKLDFYYGTDFVWFELGDETYSCAKQSDRVDVYDGINSSPLDF